MAVKGRGATAQRRAAHLLASAVMLPCILQVQAAGSRAGCMEVEEPDTTMVTSRAGFSKDVMSKSWGNTVTVYYQSPPAKTKRWTQIFSADQNRANVERGLRSTVFSGSPGVLKSASREQEYVLADQSRSWTGKWKITVTEGHEEQLDAHLVAETWVKVVDEGEHLNITLDVPVQHTTGWTKARVMATPGIVEIGRCWRLKRGQGDVRMLARYDPADNNGVSLTEWMSADEGVKLLGEPVQVSYTRFRDTLTERFWVVVHSLSLNHIY